MQQLNQLLIEFKTIHPFKFWTIIIVLILLIVIVIRKNLQKKKNHIVDLKNEVTQSDINKTIIKEDLKVEEPKSNYEKLPKEKEHKGIEAGLKFQPEIKKQLPKAKLETIKSQDEIIFVDYEILSNEKINSYPIFRYPKKGTVVRSFRIGTTKRRGFKEESFQKSIEEYFGNEFLISGNLRLNTGKETRPFEPDIAIIGKLNKKLKIDIEIDEPYAAITRQPIHCIGDDINRDLYFTDRGWIVIRFSEYQVHLHEKKCLKFIAEIIKLVIAKYEIPESLMNESPLQFENLWDVVQAQKWEKINYRENYLNHIFKHFEGNEETVERGFNEKELEEEQLVKPSFIGKIDNKKVTLFNLQNIHLRDSRIKFYPEPHIYTIDNTPAPSISTIIAKFFPEFDIEHWSRIKAIEKVKAENQDLSELNIQKTARLIRKNWEDKGKEAANKGTFLHEQIESYYLQQHYERTDEFHLFESFINDHINIKPFRTEWRVFDEKYHIAGTIDLIAKNINGYEIYDWKRSKKVISLFTSEAIKNNKWQRGVGNLSHIDDTSYNRYCLQQSLYKYILEKNYEIKISKMYLIVLYPEYDNYYKVEVPYLKNEIEYILKAL